MIYGMAVDLAVCSSSGEGEVVQAGDAEHGVVDAVALEAAVTEDLPGFHAGEDMLDPGADFSVGGVVFLFPGRQFGLAAFAAMRDQQPGAAVAAVRDHCRVAGGGLGAGGLPRLAVVAVAGQWPADGDDQSGVGVDDDLMVGGVSVVLRLLGDAVVTGGTKVPSTISTVSLRNRWRCCRTSAGARWLTMWSAAGFDTPNRGASCRRVRLVRQYVATNRTRSSSGRLHGRPLRTGSAPSRRNAVIILPN